MTTTEAKGKTQGRPLLRPESRREAIAGAVAACERIVVLLDHSAALVRGVGVNLVRRDAAGDPEAAHAARLVKSKIEAIELTVAPSLPSIMTGLGLSGEGVAAAAPAATSAGPKKRRASGSTARSTGAPAAPAASTTSISSGEEGKA